MPRKLYQPVLIAIAAATLFSLGCARQPARRIDPMGPETITTVRGLDIQDATDAAASLSQSLLESGILGRDGRPSILAIDRYINNTSEHIDRDAVMKKLRVSLNKAGVAQTMTSIDDTGRFGGESQIASHAATQRAQEADIAAFLEEDHAPPQISPDYSLTFKILDNRARAGRVRQTTYIFQMSLTDIRTGLAVWEDEKQITKQGEKAAVGW